MMVRVVSLSLMSLMMATLVGCGQTSMIASPATMPMAQAQRSIKLPSVSDADKAEAVKIVKAKLEMHVPDFWKEFRTLTIEPTIVPGELVFHGVMTSTGFTAVTKFFQVVGQVNLATKQVRVTSQTPTTAPTK